MCPAPLAPIEISMPTLWACPRAVIQRVALTAASPGVILRAWPSPSIRLRTPGGFAKLGSVEAQANGQAQALAAAMTDTLATKQDLGELETRLDARFAATKHDLVELEARMGTRFAQVDCALRAGGSALRAARHAPHGVREARRCSLRASRAATGNAAKRARKAHRRPVRGGHGTLRRANRAFSRGAR